MFKPIKKKDKIITKPLVVVDKKADIKDEPGKFKVNNKLQESIKENQRLCSLIKRIDDITLVISTIRRFYSYQALEFIRKNFYKPNKGYSSNLLFANTGKEDQLVDDNLRIYEGSADIQIYDREKRKLIRNTVEIDKKKFGSNIFPDGCRHHYNGEKLYITGGKDGTGEKKLFWLYSIKDNKLTKLPDMNHTRSYHTMIFHENLKSILVIGGENNKTCEMYDFYLNAWNELPELNVGRSNISLYIDIVGSFAYAICGTLGNMYNAVNSDAIEMLDLVDMNQGWAKIDYRNKDNVDLTFSHTGVFPLTEDKILIYGGAESRQTKKCYAIFDLRTFSILKINEMVLEAMRVQASRNPELSKIF